MILWLHDHQEDIADIERLDVKEDVELGSTSAKGKGKKSKPTSQTSTSAAAEEEEEEEERTLVIDEEGQD